MKICLLKPARVQLAAGTVVDTDPAQAGFLVAVGSAEIVTDTEQQEEKPKKSARKSATK